MMGCVGWVSVGTAKYGERAPRGCVGCVIYGRSSAVGEGSREGEDEIGSGRYIVC